jgi:hypothetical protein
MVIALDFDGTVVSHEFPAIGKDIGAIHVLKELIENGHKLILYTMRSDREEGNYLLDAINWFYKNDIELYSIQENPEQKHWTTSPKCYAQLYIDDAALGIPLKIDKSISEKSFVDWIKVKELLKEMEII